MMRSLLWTSSVLLALLAALGACSDGAQHGDMSTASSDTLVTLHPRALCRLLNDLGDDGNVQRLHVNALGRLREVFNDTNDMQLPAAMAGGIDPVNDLRSAYHLKRPIQRIYSCDEFVLDSLWMSMPYLVPRAAQLLKDIGRTFQDTVHARGGGDYRIKVTSVLRTEYSASRLRRRNRNASEQSCHRYGTTFDISWTKFDCMDTTRLVSLEDLKNILAEVIQDKRQQGRCYAIYERKQGCFHVTVR